jgi:excisionase family DNA binding protein
LSKRNGHRPVENLIAEAAEVAAVRLEEFLARYRDGDRSGDEQIIATALALVTLRPPERRGLLTTNEMSQAMHLTPKTLRKLLQAGKLQAYRLGSRGGPPIRWVSPV